MTFTFAKSPKFIGGAAILVALIVGFFFYRGYHQKPTSSLPVAKVPATTTPSPTASAASAPASQPIKTDKPSPFGPPISTAEPEKKSEKSKLSVSVPKPPKPTVGRDGKKEVTVTSEQLAKFSKLLETLVSQGITVHLIDETPRAEETAEIETEEKPISDKQREEAFKEQIRKGRLP